MEGDNNYWDNWMRRRMSRRTVLRQAGLTGLVLAGGSSLWACGSNTETPKAQPAATSQPGATPQPTTAKPSPTPEARPKRGGTLKIGGSKNVNFTDLNPHTAFVSTDEPFLKAIYDTLVDYNDKLEYVTARSLAESWEVVDDVTLLFKLRKGIKFTDGTAFDAKVVRYNFERIADPEVKSPRNYIADAMKNVEYPDDNTVKITLKEPMASFFGEVSYAGMGMVSPANVAKWSSKELALNPVGTGPFMLTEKVMDDHFTYARNKDFWRKDAKGDALPYLDAIRFVVVPDATVRLAQLRTGQIDVDMATAFKDVAKIKDDPNLQVVVQDGVRTNALWWNLSRPPFNNLNFRRACNLAINREAMVKTITFGICTPYNGLVIPAHAWAYDPKRPPIPYDPVKAKQYLDQAIAQGVKPEFKNDSDAGRDMQMAELIQADLAKIGIKMTIVPAATATSSYRYFTSFEVDSRTSGYSMSPDPYGKIYQAHHGKGMYTPERKELGDKWDTPEGYYAKVDPALEAINKVYDPKKRAKLLYDAGQIVDDNVAYLMLYFESTVTSLRKDVTGFSPGGDGRGRYEATWLNR